MTALVKGCDRPTPFAEYIGKGFPHFDAASQPPPRDALRTFVHSLDAEIDTRTFQVEQLRSALASALNELDSVQTFRHVHACIFPPVHYLPPEILAEIFSLTFDKAYNIRPHSDTGPWRLIQVCQHWKNVACSTPALWTSFRVVNDLKDDTQYVAAGAEEYSLSVWRQHLGDMLANVLKWSSPMPLNIVVHVAALSTQSLEDLCKESHRWESVAFSDKFLHHYTRVPSLRLPSLKALTLHIPYDQPAEDADAFKVLERFASADRLRSLTLSFPDLPRDVVEDPMRIVFPWVQITELNLQYEYRRSDIAQSSFRFLRCCPELQVFRQSGFNIVPSTQHPSDVIVCTHLRSFRFRDYVTQFLGFIECPQLVHFYIPPLRSRSEALTVIEFVRRSLSLTRVDIIISDYSAEGCMDEVLRELGEVEALTIDVRSRMKQLDQICDALRAGALVPRMTRLTLKLDMRYQTLVSAEHVLEAVRSRMQSGLRSASFELYTSDPRRMIGTSNNISSYGCRPGSHLHGFVRALEDFQMPGLQWDTEFRLKLFR